MPRARKHTLDSPKRSLGAVVGKFKSGSYTREQAENILTRWMEDGKINAAQLRGAMKKIDKSAETPTTVSWLTMDELWHENIVNDLNSDSPQFQITLNGNSSMEWYDPTASYKFKIVFADARDRRYTEWLCAIPVLQDLSLPKPAREHLEDVFERSAAPFCFPQDVTFERRK